MACIGFRCDMPDVKGTRTMAEKKTEIQFWFLNLKRLNFVKTPTKIASIKVIKMTAL